MFKGKKQSRKLTKPSKVERESIRPLPPPPGLELQPSGMHCQPGPDPEVADHPLLRHQPLSDHEGHGLPAAGVPVPHR